MLLCSFSKKMLKNPIKKMSNKELKSWYNSLKLRADINIIPQNKAENKSNQNNEIQIFIFFNFI